MNVVELSYYINEKHNGKYVCIDKKTNKEIQQFYVQVRGSVMPTEGIVPVGSGGSKGTQISRNYFRLFIKVIYFKILRYLDTRNFQ